MTNGKELDHETKYEIRVKDHLDSTWTDWLDGFMITQLENETILSGKLVDQAALSGLIGKVIGLGLTVISVQRIPEENQ